MGDIFSKKTVSTTNLTQNQQVALQGRGMVGISGSDVRGANILVENSDPEVVLAALQGMGTASNNSSIVALGALQSTQGSVQAVAAAQGRALDTVDKSLSLAAGVNNASHQTVMYTLDALNQFQNRALESTDRAVASAQETAQKATPYSAGAYAEVIGAQSSGERQKIFFAIFAIVVVGGVIAVSRNKP